jgi:DNA primase
LKLTSSKSTSEAIPSSSELLTFLDERGISYEIAGKAGLYVEEEGKYAGWLAIPYPNVKGIWKVRYRRLDEGKPKYMDEAGAEPHLYNPQKLGPQTRTVWFTEGELDALILWQYGVHAIGVPGSSIFGIPEFRLAWSLLWDKSKLVAAIDNDEAGNRAAHALVEVYGDRVQRIMLPEGLDVNDMHLKDPSGLKELIDSVE